MTTVTLKGHLVAAHYSFMEPGAVSWRFTQYKGDQLDGDDIASFPHEFTFEAPEINVVAAQVAGLNAAKEKALADYQATVAQINEQLSKLLAITNEVEA